MSNAELRERIATLVAMADSVGQNLHQVPDWDTVISELKILASKYHYTDIRFTKSPRFSGRVSVTNRPHQDTRRVIHYYGATPKRAAYVLAHEVGHVLCGHLDGPIGTPHSQREREAWAKAKELIREYRGTVPSDFAELAAQK